MIRRTTPLVAALALAATCCRAQISVTNLSSGTELRYPVALLAGEATGAATVRVANAQNPGPDGRNEVSVFGGRFRLLVRLVPGTNHLELSAGEERLSLDLAYRPMANPRQVRVLYLTGSEGETVYPTQVQGDPQNYEAKLRTAAELMQTFTAEVLHEAGFGRATFSLERDAEGQVVVHTLRLSDPAEVIRSRDPGDQWQISAGEIGSTLDFGMTKVLAINGFVVYDTETGQARGHTALGGGSLAVFSSNSLCAWPSSLRDVQRAFLDDTPSDSTKLWDDTAGRGTMWALASTGIGAWLHELGHAFGLPHSPDPRAIMARGIDRFNRSFVPIEAPRRGRAEPYLFGPDETARWDPFFAARLALSPWFQADGLQASGKPEPRVRLDWETDRLLIEAPAGLALLQYEAGNKRVSLPHPEAGAAELSLDHAALKRELGAQSGIQVMAMDREGRGAGYDTAGARNPAWFISTWRLSPEPVEWASVPAPRELDAEQVQQIVRTLSVLAPETWTPDPYAQQYSFDLNGRYGYHGNSLAYALRTIRVDAETRVKLLAGGDDGLRAWVNGDLVLDATGVHVIAADGVQAEVTLRAGDNTLLVESQQGPGSWLFSTRLATPDGAPLALGADGRLTQISR